MEFVFSDPLVLGALLAAAFLAGLVDAIAGGGGLITVPALLTAGMPPHLCLGTNKLAATFGSFTAARTYIKKRLFNPRFWMAAIIATFIGATLGTGLVMMINAEALAQYLPLLILGAGIYMLMPQRKQRFEAKLAMQPSKSRSIALGSTLGFYDGFFGPGTGAFWTTLAMATFKVDLVQASGIARFMNFVSNAASLLAFIILGSVDFAVGLALGLTLMAGAWIGAHSAIRFGAGFIRPVFILLVLAMAARLAWLQWFV